MPITLNGTTGVTTPGAIVGSITGILKATSGVVSQAIAGTDYGQITLATAQTASGSAINFTGIPSWAKRITVMFNGLKTGVATLFEVTLGTSSGLETSGYRNSNISTNSSGTFAGDSTSGQYFARNYDSVQLSNGMITISLLGSNTWIITALSGTFDNADSVTSSGGSKTLAGTLDRIQITPSSGSFTGGTINISYE